MLSKSDDALNVSKAACGLLRLSLRSDTISEPDWQTEAPVGTPTSRAGAFKAATPISYDSPEQAATIRRRWPRGVYVTGVADTSVNNVGV
jgi:hypothetical protein